MTQVVPLKLKQTYDEWDCETCGGSYASAYEFTVNGKTYGGEASAHCFGGYSNNLEDLLLEFLNDLGYTFEEDSE